uniref:Inhibitor of growth protein N-terminal histone-binding domain-containing protein n=1 Tax=Otus sunia TaxID=257818 RepID=A0A8C8AVQ0_9STRI
CAAGDYLECVESLPLDIQRNASLLREMDTQCQGGRCRGTRPPP